MTNFGKKYAANKKNNPIFVDPRFQNPEISISEHKKINLTQTSTSKALTSIGKALTRHQQALARHYQALARHQKGTNKAQRHHPALTRH